MELFTSLEESLVSDAYPQERTISRDPGPNRIQEALPLHGVDAVIEGAHAGQNNPCGTDHGFRSACPHDLRTGLAEGLFHAADISGIVIEECDHRR
jgi:hypothetical protein